MAASVAQYMCEGHSSASQVISSIPTNIPLGTGVVLAVQFDDISATVSGISDTIGNPYSVVQGPIRNASNTQYTYKVPVVSGSGANTVTISLSSLVSNVETAWILYVGATAIQIQAQAQGPVAGLLAIPQSVRAGTVVIP